MQFKVAQMHDVSGLVDTAILVPSSWDDWFRFETSFSLILFDSSGKRIDAGTLKIGMFGQAARKPSVPDNFPELGDEFFSLGQDENYYEVIYSLGVTLRKAVFSSLKDCAFDLNRFERAKNEVVMRESLLRFVSEQTVVDRFSRIAQGNATLTDFQFSYRFPTTRSELPPLCLQFAVEPSSNPPSNIHVIIGRNGVGKTTCFRLMTHALRGDEEATSGAFSSQTGEVPFANIVSVAFSAFDPFDPLPEGQMGRGKLRYAYVGLRRPPEPSTNENAVSSSDDPALRSPKTPAELNAEFVSSLERCSSGPRAERWGEAMASLASDPLFEEADVIRLLGVNGCVDREHAVRTFKRLSSGHKIVLLTITRLVELVDERTLVLIDEPEAHLHPPLLAAFVRALSYLLVKRNGVSIIATHSPVVLQEVPRRCVWIMARSGIVTTAHRPETETFGENVGILTREVFGLEVTHSGFHKLLLEKASTVHSYEELVSAFGGELGAEAKAIARAMFSTR